MPAAPATPTRKTTVPTAKIHPKNRRSSFIHRPFAATLRSPANLSSALGETTPALCAPNQSVSKSGNRLTPPVLWSNLGFPFAFWGLPCFMVRSVGTPLWARPGKRRRKVCIHRLRERVGGPLPPGVGRHQLEVLLVRHITKLDQHRGDIRGFQHLEPRGLERMLVQFGGVL